MVTILSTPSLVVFKCIMMLSTLSEWKLGAIYRVVLDYDVNVPERYWDVCEVSTGYTLTRTFT